MVESFIVVLVYGRVCVGKLGFLNIDFGIGECKYLSRIDLVFLFYIKLKLWDRGDVFFKEGFFLFIIVFCKEIE